MPRDQAPPLHLPTIDRHARALGERDVDVHAAVALLVATQPRGLQALPYANVVGERMRRAGYKLGDDKPFVTDLPNARATRLALAGLARATGAFERLTAARKLVAAQMERRCDSMALAVAGHDEAAAGPMLEALLAAALAADFALPEYKSTRQKTRRLGRISVHGLLPESALARTLAGARGNNLARYLTALPANELTPGTYRRRAERLAKANGWRSEFMDIKKLRRLGAGAFLAVAQGSPDADAGILRLRYAPRRNSGARVALVGKGICFDTGGVNLKSAKHMHGMHEDMEGSAVALGTLLALSELRVDFPVDCWLALAQNHIGPRAYRPNEVVTAADGKTIEIVHTDAEGRLVLADTLTLAAGAAPKLIVDYATLTGACIGALGTRMSGVLSNRNEWLTMLIKAGVESGERTWPFPLADDYAEPLKSDVADIKQCAIENEADQILAALFLRRFVPDDIGWVHLDLAAGNHKGGLAHVPTDVTGFGVRFTLNLLLEQGILG